MQTKVLLLVASLLMLEGCATLGGPKQTTGTLVGGATGAVIGAQFGGGTGQVAATAIGTLAGAVVGGEIGRNMDNQDRAQQRR